MSAAVRSVRLDAVQARSGFEWLLVKRNIGRGRWVIHEYGAGDPRHDLPEHFNPLAAQRCLDVDESRDIAAGVRQAFDEPAPDGIGNDDEHDGDGLGLALKRCGDSRRLSYQNVRPQSDQFFCEGTHAFEIGDAEAVIDLDVASLDPSEITKRRPECREPLDDLRVALGPAEQHADPAHLRALLSVRSQRPSCRRRTEQLDKFAPFHSVLAPSAELSSK